MSKLACKPRIPKGTPSIGLVVRLIDGVPLMFTERGEYVRHQIDVSVHSPLDEMVSAVVKLYTEIESSEPPAQPKC